MIIDLEATADMDTTAADQLDRPRGRAAQVRRAGHAGADCTEPLRDFMEKDGLVETDRRRRIYPRVLDAVRSFEATAG